MVTDLDLDSVPGVALGVARGRLTLAEAKDSAAAMWARVEGPVLRILWDLSEAEFDLEAAEIRELAEFVKSNSPRTDLRTAFVVSGDLEFGLIRMFEVFRESEDAQTSVFRSREPALAWLADGDA